MPEWTPMASVQRIPVKSNRHQRRRVIWTGAAETRMPINKNNVYLVFKAAKQAEKKVEKASVQMAAPALVWIKDILSLETVYKKETML